MDTSPLSAAIALVGLGTLARALNVTHQAVRKWERTGLPRTEWTGETSYAECIERLTHGKVQKSALMVFHHPLAARTRAPRDRGRSESSDSDLFSPTEQERGAA